MSEEAIRRGLKARNLGLWVSDDAAISTTAQDRCSARTGRSMPRPRSNRSTDHQEGAGECAARTRRQSDAGQQAHIRSFRLGEVCECAALVTSPDAEILTLAPFFSPYLSTSGL